MSDLITSQKYLDGELSPEEKIEFEEQLNFYAALSDEINLIKEVNETLSDTELQNFEHKVKSLIISERNSKSTTIPQRSLYKFLLAASIALIIGFLSIIIISNTKTSNENLYAQFYEKYDPGIVSRSDASTANIFSRALKNYANADYELAFQLFNIINIESSTTNYLSQYYSGLCKMELMQYQEAISYFKQISIQYPAIKTHSDWYLALCYIKTNKTVEAKELLNKIINSDGYYQNKAVELLPKLKD